MYQFRMRNVEPKPGLFAPCRIRCLWRRASVQRTSFDTLVRHRMNWSFGNSILHLPIGSVIRIRYLNGISNALWCELREWQCNGEKVGARVIRSLKIRESVLVYSPRVFATIGGRIRSRWCMGLVLRGGSV